MLDVVVVELNRSWGEVMDWAVVQKLGVSLGLGLLVGFQREWTAPHVAGIRTFALITVFGTVVGLFVEPLGAWIVAAGLLALAAVLVVGNFLKFSGVDQPPGLTTQVAALIMYIVGVGISLDKLALSVIVGGGVAVLLHWKRPLHRFVERIGEQDIRAIIQLVVVALVILPLLPDKDYGPYRVLNPFEIWLMVVLICGISLGGYIAYKFFGTRAGTLLSGILGGLISSTATTVSYSRWSRRAPEATKTASVVIMIASTVVFARVIGELAIVAPKVLPALLPPLAVMLAITALVSAGLYIFSPVARQPAPNQEDPADLKAAFLFGALYAAVLFAVAAVKEHYGDQALFAVAIVSGLTDVDAITLSTAQMIKAERLTVDTGWRIMLLGAMSNLAFKGCLVVLIGNRQLLVRIAIVFGVSLACGAILLWLWP